MKSQNLILVDTSGSMIPFWENIKQHLKQLDSLITQSTYIFTNSKSKLITKNLREDINRVSVIGLTNFFDEFIALINEVKPNTNTTIHLFTDGGGKYNPSALKNSLDKLPSEAVLTLYGVNKQLSKKMKLNLDSLNIHIFECTYLTNYFNTQNNIQKLIGSKDTEKQLVNSR